VACSRADLFALVEDRFLDTVERAFESRLREHGNRLLQRAIPGDAKRLGAGVLAVAQIIDRRSGQADRLRGARNAAAGGERVEEGGLAIGGNTNLR